jgi:Ca2+-binding EF-hand superfamily protein
VLSLKNCFRACDVNQDGVFSETDARALFESQGQPISHSEVRILLGRLGKGGKGVSRRAFLAELRVTQEGQPRANM